MAEMRILMAHMDDPDQVDIDTYIKNGGYQAIKKAIPGIAPAELIEMVKQSGLRGRGGAGFLTGMKWGFVPKDAPVKYLVCNCDESEPGTFKDRLIIERDPHQLIEGMILTSYAIGARLAFIYCRGEFFEGTCHLAARRRSGKRKGIWETSWDRFRSNIIVHPGAGAYIAGEETASAQLFGRLPCHTASKTSFSCRCQVFMASRPSSITSKRSAMSSTSSTVVSNGITSIGKPKNTGTKIFQISGQVQKPGCYEFPLGVPLREVLQCCRWHAPGTSVQSMLSWRLILRAA